MKFLIPYLVIVNAAAFLLMLIDKQKAKRKLWRIPEATLLGAAAIGGSVGALLGMYIFRHKTRHIKFTAGIPLLMFVHFGLLIWLLSYYGK